MPLPSDEKLLQLANDLVQQFDAIFGLHPVFAQPMQRAFYSRARSIRLPTPRR